MHRAGMSKSAVSSWRRWGALAGFCLVLAAGLPAGCGKKSTTELAPSEPKHEDAPPAGTAWIKATPNPIKGSGLNAGTTTISWDTGGDPNGNTKATVYLVRPNKSTLFSGGKNGSKPVDWIHKGVKYDFVLYADEDRKTELARVTVTME